MDIKLRNIVNKAPGVFFIVTDASQVQAIAEEPKMRLIFINVEKGPINIMVKFAKGDITGFYSIFGKGTRLQEKRGNLSISTCIDALTSGPIAVINLRAFDDTLDTTTVLGLNPNINAEDTSTVPYRSLFNINQFWSPKASNIPSLLTNNEVLTFGSVGNNDISVIVTKAKDITNLTAEGEKTLFDSILEIDEYPALNFETLVKDTFVDVYIFNNIFNPLTVGTNPYYGQLFDNSGNIDFSNIDTLTSISQSGFIAKYTGSLIPNLISESSQEISIDNILNSNYINTGLISYINTDLFEADNKLLLDLKGISFFDEAGLKVDPSSDYMLSHVVPAELTTSTTTYPLTLKAQNVIPVSANLIAYKCVKISDTEFEGSFEQGIRIDDEFNGTNGIVKVTDITILDPIAVIGVTTDTYTKVKITTSGPVTYTSTNTVVTKVISFVENSLIHPFGLISYKPRLEQFTTGSADKQSEILDMMNDPGIVKGIKSESGIRYIVDAFKSFIEASYKYQFGQLCYSLDQSNVFVRAIINEPFVEDLQNSTNPLFKQLPGGTFDWTYVPIGGNKTYSTKFLTKFSTGADMCFFYGPGNIVGSVTKGIAGLVSNLFYTKSFDFDIVANESGYIDGITSLEVLLTDDDRISTENFKYNPIIQIDGNYTIYGNLTGQKIISKQSQIQNSELLAYIKLNLYAIGKKEAFKKDNYDDYLRTESQAKNFMDSLALVGAINANPIVICNASNNTKEIANNKIKLVYIEYTPANSLEKVVFDLKID